ncbi:MAG: L-allo-threonine aldolase [Candidatus Heimdallarchaeota archaeon LC_3]|nr:MAG: L-allo-threonine aldolase [Candidatus Heimdallarchaeota archaeon LC_3]
MIWCYPLVNDDNIEVDLRSDTKTLPTKEMIEAISNAKLGDDQAREDPTVIELEEKSAKLFRKEEGLLVTSGTQGNLLSILSQTDGRGSEIIVEKDAHCVFYEVGNLAALGGIMVRTLTGKNGYIDPDDVKNTIRSDFSHYPKTALVSLENTHNRAGGCAFTVDQMDSMGKLAQEYDIGFHVDGARIFNAAFATNSSVQELTKTATSVTFCLSKGLSCPIGSIIVGSSELISRARKLRQMLGGSMRQAGIIAAPGLVALNNFSRIKDDNENAKLLADGIKSYGSNAIKVSDPDSNIVLAQTAISSDDFIQKLADKNILVYGMGPNTTRFVTHRLVNKEDIELSIERIGEMLKEMITF